MKGASIPMGPDVVNFSVREPRGVVARIMPFNHPFMFAAGKSAAPLAAGNSVIIKPPDQAPLSSLRLAELVEGLLPPGRVQRGAGRPRRRRRARRASGGRDGRDDRQRARGTRGDARCERDGEARAARARRQECLDRLSRCRSTGGRRRPSSRRHELHLVRPIVRLDEPSVRAPSDLRAGAGGRGARDRDAFVRAFLPTPKRRWVRSSARPNSSE